jgi:diacylglycerol kinase (ATP)
LASLLLVNPNSGRGRGRKLADQAAQWLAEDGLEVEMVLTASEDEAANPSLGKRDWERVIVVGGDGTMNSVLSWLAGTEIPLGILPVGTSNGLAREVKLPLDLRKACRVAAGEGRRRVDLGCANGRPFALMASAGFDAKVVHGLGNGLKNMLGPVAYVAVGLRVVAGYPSADLRITTDDQELEIRAWMAVVANAPTYTYTWRIAPDARMDDGLLDLIIFADRTARDRVSQIIGALSARHLNHPRVLALRGRRFEISAEPQVCLQVDGDRSGYTPVSVEVMPQACTIIVAEEGQC